MIIVVKACGEPVTNTYTCDYSEECLWKTGFNWCKVTYDEFKQLLCFEFSFVLLLIWLSFKVKDLNLICYLAFMRKRITNPTGISNSIRRFLFRTANHYITCIIHWQVVYCWNFVRGCILSHYISLVQTYFLFIFVDLYRTVFRSYAICSPGVCCVLECRRNSQTQQILEEGWYIDEKQQAAKKRRLLRIN